FRAACRYPAPQTMPPEGLALCGQLLHWRRFCRRAPPAPPQSPAAPLSTELGCAVNEDSGLVEQSTVHRYSSYSLIADADHRVTQNSKPSIQGTGHAHHIAQKTDAAILHIGQTWTTQV